MTKAERNKRLRVLLKRWTRCEIMARLGSSVGLTFIDYAMKEIQYKDKIRKLMYGSSDLVKLGNKWGLLRRTKSQEEKR